MPRLRLALAAVLAVVPLVMLGCNPKPTQLTATPQGTLTATVTESVTTTKTIPCITVTKSGDSYVCTPEATPTDCTANPSAPGCTPPPGGGLPAITCPSGSMVITGQWGQTAIQTSTYGTFNQQWLAVEVKPPVGWTGNGGIKTSSWAEYQDGGAVRTAMFATQPCTHDLRYAMKVKGGTGGNAYSTDAISVAFKYTTAASENLAVTVVPGQTYWINIKNTYGDGSSSCTNSCNMRGGLPQ